MLIIRNPFIIEEGAEVIIEGDVFIAPGMTIRVKKGAKAVFKGKNLIAHNFTLICGEYFELGENSHVSWNCTMIDDDGHTLFNREGRPLKQVKKN